MNPLLMIFQLECLERCVDGRGRRGSYKDDDCGSKDVIVPHFMEGLRVACCVFTFLSFLFGQSAGA